MTFVWALSFSFSLISLEGKSSPFEPTRLCCIYLIHRIKLYSFVIINFEADFRHVSSSVLECVAVRRRTCVFAFCSEGLVWAGFVEQALERFWDASANVTFRLPKARIQGCF